MISNNFKETKRVFFGHTLRTLLNSDHIMPSDINSLLKSKGIISPSSDKKETVPLLSALILSPSELNSLLEKTISHEKNPKHRTSNLALSKPNSAWMREIQRVNLTPLVTQLQNEFTNIKFKKYPKLTYINTKEAKLEYIIERSDFSKDIIYREQQFEADILFQETDGELNVEIFSTHTCKETDDINNKIINTYTKHLKTEKLIQKEEAEKTYFSDFTNKERILLLKRFSDTKGSNLILGKIIDVLITIDDSVPNFPKDKEIGWMNKVIKNLRISGDDLGDLLLISNKNYPDYFIIKDINITYELMEGTNHVEVKVNYNFSSKKDMTKSELTYEINNMIHKNIVNESSKKEIRRSINKNICSLIKSHKNQIIHQRSLINQDQTPPAQESFDLISENM